MMPGYGGSYGTGGDGAQPTDSTYSPCNDKATGEMCTLCPSSGRPQMGGDGNDGGSQMQGRPMFEGRPINGVAEAPGSECVETEGNKHCTSAGACEFLCNEDAFWSDDEKAWCCTNNPKSPTCMQGQQIRIDIDTCTALHSCGSCTAGLGCSWTGNACVSSCTTKKGGDQCITDTKQCPCQAGMVLHRNTRCQLPAANEQDERTMHSVLLSAHRLSLCVCVAVLLFHCLSLIFSPALSLARTHSLARCLSRVCVGSLPVPYSSFSQSCYSLRLLHMRGPPMYSISAAPHDYASTPPSRTTGKFAVGEQCIASFKCSGKVVASKVATGSVCGFVLPACSVSSQIEREAWVGCLQRTRTSVLYEPMGLTAVVLFVVVCCLDFFPGGGGSCSLKKCDVCLRNGDKEDLCKMCNQKQYLLNGECVASCPADMTSVGYGSKGRICQWPFSWYMICTFTRI